MFNKYINDLVTMINSINNGLSYGDDQSISILLYTDDIVLLSDSELGLQALLSCIGTYCTQWGLSINASLSLSLRLYTYAALANS